MFSLQSLEYVRIIIVIKPGVCQKNYSHKALEYVRIIIAIKPGVCQNIVMYALPTAKNFFLVLI